MNNATIKSVEAFVVDVNTKAISPVLGELLIGRGEGGLHYPTDQEMSRKHLRVFLLNGMVLMEDLGSTNGTKINGQFVEKYASIQLKSGDVIEAGGQRLMLQIEMPSALSAEDRENTQITALLPPDNPAKPCQPSPPQRAAPLRAPAPPPLPIPTARSEQPSVGSRLSSSLEQQPKLEVEGQPASVEERNLDNLIVSLMEKKCAWYVLFETSEFGPFSLDELKKVLESPMFQAGKVFVWAEGLDDWCPSSSFGSLINGKKRLETTAKVARSARLLATVVCHVTQNGAERQLEADCEEIGTFGITIFRKEKVVADSNTFVLDVQPLPNAGLDPFSVKVRLELTNMESKTQMLTYLNLSAGQKMSIERYINSKAKD